MLHPGDKVPSAMGNLRPRTPTKAALTARAHALRSSQVGRQQPVPLGNQAEPASTDADAVKGLIVSSPQVCIQWCAFDGVHSMVCN